MYRPRGSARLEWRAIARSHQASFCFIHGIKTADIWSGRAWQAAAEALLNLLEGLEAPALVQLLADAPTLRELLTAPPGDALPEVQTCAMFVQEAPAQL